MKEPPKPNPHDDYQNTPFRDSVKRIEVTMTRDFFPYENSISPGREECG